jgi:hydroxypyruvate isomerase
MSLGVCIELFYAEAPYAARIRKVKELGFSSYEFWFPDKRFDGSALTDEPKDFDELADLNRSLGLTTTDFVLNHPAGGIQASLIDPADRSRLVGGIGRVIERAKKIGCGNLICASGDRREGVSSRAALDCMVGTLRALLPQCEAAGITLLLEPFNTRVDHPSAFLDDPEACVEVLKAVGSPRVKMLFDIYHMQIMHGDILSFVRANLDWIGHFHVAGVPGRHEPCPCELDYAHIISEIRGMGYGGAFDLEYWPTVESGESLLATRSCLEGRSR